MNELAPVPADNVLSMRITPELRFKIEFIGRVRGQSIKTVVERAIADVVRMAIDSGEIDSAQVEGLIP